MLPLEVLRLYLRRAISQMRVHQVLQLLADCCVAGNKEVGQASRLEHQGPVSVLENLVDIVREQFIQIDSHSLSGSCLAYCTL